MVTNLVLWPLTQAVTREEREIIARLRNCILALVQQRIMLFDTSIQYTYDASLKYEVRAWVPLPPSCGPLSLTHNTISPPPSPCTQAFIKRTARVRGEGSRVRFAPLPIHIGEGVAKIRSDWRDHRASKKHVHWTGLKPFLTILSSMITMPLYRTSVHSSTVS